jgi:predicted kinase
MRIYDWTRTLGEARTAVRALAAQRDSIKSDIGAGAPADSLSARITRLGADVDRAFNAVNAQRAPIEGWSGLPSVDQRKALDYALDDARKAMAELNKLVATDIPAAYKVAKKEWRRAVKGVAAPTVGKSP